MLRLSYLLYFDVFPYILRLPYYKRRAREHLYRFVKYLTTMTIVWLRSSNLFHFYERMCHIAITGISRRFKWITVTLQTTLKPGGSLTMLSSNPWKSELLHRG